MIREKLYAFYRHRFYPLIKNVRGATKLNDWLSRASLYGLETVDESDATSIFDADDWDALILLDACRHDLYEEVRGKESVPYRISLGSRTSEFLKKTFSEGDFSDVVYITANPHFYGDVIDEVSFKERFHEVFMTFQNGWDDERNTVLPDPVVSDAKTAAKLFPDKRLIVHFMQPHHPMVPFQVGNGFGRYLEADNVPDSVWGLAEQGKVSQGEAWKAYEMNLRYVMPHVERLADFLSERDNKVVLTSDHGNVVGENQRYGHPKNSSAKVLRKVPWEVLRNP